LVLICCYRSNQLISIRYIQSLRLLSQVLSSVEEHRFRFSSCIVLRISSFCSHQSAIDFTRLSSDIKSIADWCEQKRTYPLNVTYRDQLIRSVTTYTKYLGVELNHSLNMNRQTLIIHIRKPVEDCVYYER
jgi:hypothetical protein